MKQFLSPRSSANTGNRTPKTVKMILSEDVERTLRCPLMLKFKSRQGFLSACPQTSCQLLLSQCYPCRSTHLVEPSLANCGLRTLGSRSQGTQPRASVYYVFVFVLASFLIHVTLGSVDTEPVHNW